MDNGRPRKLSSPSASGRAAGAPAWWLYGFLLFQFACQSALVLSPIGSMRFVLRAAIYLSSAALLVLPAAGGRPFPLRGLVVAVLVITGLGLFHPQVNSQRAALGQFGITLAVWGPALWVGRIRLTPEAFRRVLLLVWGFNTLSAVIGVLQVYDPGRFSPDPVFLRQMLGEAVADGLKITLDDGRQVFRPMGLSDQPGGAAAAGSFIILAGFGLIWQSRSPLLRYAIVLAAVIGMFCLYLCQLRSTLIVTAVSLVGIVGVMVVRGQARRASVVTVLAATVVLGGFIWAASVGREAVTSRLSSLTEESAGKFYYSSRGFFLEITLTEELPKYPLGAGLGRWGMMYNYFGDPNNTSSPGLYSEIQASGWVYDGGLPLLLAGYAAIVGALVMATRLALHSRSQKVADMAAVVAAFDLGVVATTFGYPAFIGETGMMFWVLNAALFAAAGRPDPPPAARPEA